MSDLQHNDPVIINDEDLFDGYTYRVTGISKGGLITIKRPCNNGFIKRTFHKRILLKIKPKAFIFQSKIAELCE